MAQSYRADRSGFRDLMTSSGISRAAVAAAEAGARAAQASAPRDSGAYANGFVVQPVTERVRGEARAAAVLGNTTRHAHVVEKRARVLARAIDDIERA